MYLIPFGNFDFAKECLPGKVMVIQKRIVKDWRVQSLFL